MKRHCLVGTPAILVSMIVFLLCIPSLSHAEIKAGSINFSLLVGGYTFDNKIGDDQGYLTTGLTDLDTRFSAGLGIGYNFTEHLGVELMGNNVWGKFDHQGGLSDRNLQADLYHLDVLYHFMPEQRFVPYFAIGGGVITYDPADKALDSVNEAMADYGLGFKYFISPSVALRGDVRHVLTFPHRNNDITNNALYNIGLTFAFGGTGKPEEVAPAPAPAPAPEPQPAPQEEVVPAPAPAPAPTEMEKAIVEKGRVTLDIQFDTNKAVVKEKYNAELAKFADVMKKHPDLKVTIEGHTDNVGKAEMNQKLSQKRAESVKNYLVTKFGIDASRLDAKGYGMTKPIADNKTKAGRQKNRRVEAAVEYENTVK